MLHFKSSLFLHIINFTQFHRIFCLARSIVFIEVSLEIVWIRLLNLSSMNGCLIINEYNTLPRLVRWMTIIFWRSEDIQDGLEEALDTTRTISSPTKG